MALQLNTNAKASYFVIYDIDREKHMREFDKFEQMMNWICREIAFSDCTDIEFDMIYALGMQIHYMGWRPQMQMTFYAGEDKHNIVWDNYYPEYDH